MLCKNKQKQEEKEVLFKQKTKCLNSISNFIENLQEESNSKQEVLQNLQKLKQFEQDELLSQNKYFEQVASMTDRWYLKFLLISVTLIQKYNGPLFLTHKLHCCRYLLLGI